jgi:hypothetical protein
LFGVGCKCWIGYQELIVIINISARMEEEKNQAEEAA